MYQVSIIIPIYNVREYVGSSLNSALNQTFQSIEYILVDDCGTDESMDIVKRMLVNHPRKKDIFIYKHEKNYGLSAARNTGLAKATGEYVFFMDSDDEIIPQCIELHYRAIMNRNADFTVANILLKGAKSIHIRPVSDDIENFSPLLTYMKRKWSASAWNKLYRRKFIQANNFVFKEGLIHEDVLWSYQISNKAQKLAFVIESTYIYKIHQNSITTKKNGMHKIDSLLYILQYMYTEWTKGRIPVLYRSIFFRMFDFKRLNVALLLLDFDGDCNICNSYYNQLKMLGKNRRISVCYFMLKLPFPIFKTMIAPFYLLYKQTR